MSYAADEASLPYVAVRRPTWLNFEKPVLSGIGPPNPWNVPLVDAKNV